MRTLLLALLIVGLSAGSNLQAQRKKKSSSKDGPVVLMALPFGIAPGKAVKLTLRGQRLENATEVRLAPKGSVKLIRKGKANVPNQQEAAKVGDSEIEVEVTVPADVPGDRVQVTAVTPAGESKPLPILIDRTPPVAEKEPNDGFRTAQTVKVGETVQGTISRGQDVDVYRFEGKEGQKVVIEVMAARLGSALDSFLTLYDEAGQVVATSDDLEDSSDSRIEVTLKRTGAYLVSVTDAHDQGGVTHGYRLTVRE